MKRKVLLFAVLVCLLCLLCGCSFSFGSYYADAEKYSVGDVVLTEPVKEIRIHWPSEQVDVCVWDGEGVSVAETCSDDLSDDLRVHYYLNGTTLNIQFAAPGVGMPFSPKKHLTVSVPEGVLLDELRVEVASAKVTVNGVKMKKLSADSASGDVTVSAPADVLLDELRIDVASAKVTVDGVKTKKLTADSASGHVSITGAQADEIDIETSSGDITLRMQTAKDLHLSSASGKIRAEVLSPFDEWEAETASGDMELTVSDAASFTAEVSQASGKFTCDLPVVMKGKGKYVYGSGAGELELESASGDIHIYAADKK